MGTVYSRFSSGATPRREANTDEYPLSSGDIDSDWTVSVVKERAHPVIVCRQAIYAPCHSSMSDVTDMYIGDTPVVNDMVYM